MSKWVQFYHKENEFDYVNKRFTDDFSIVEMVGMDSVLPIDGRWNMSSIRAAIQRKNQEYEKNQEFRPLCVLYPCRSFTSSLFRKSGVQSLARTGQYDNVLPAINQNRIYYE